MVIYYAAKNTFMEEAVKLYRFLRDTQGDSALVKLEIWNGTEGKDYFILSQLPPPGNRRRREWCNPAMPLSVVRGGRPKTFAEAVNTQKYY